jgi:hypothetical protein
MPKIRMLPIYWGAGTLTGEFAELSPKGNSPYE